MPRELLRNSSYRNSNIVGFLINFSLFGGIFMFSLFLQKALGNSPFMARVDLMPGMVVFIIGNMLFAKLTQYFGVKKPMVIALSISFICSLILGFLGSSTSYFVIIAIYAIANLGVGVAVPAMTSIIMEASDKSNANIASATLNASRQIGALVGVAVMSFVISMIKNWYSVENVCFILMAIGFFIAVSLTYFFLKEKTQA